MRAVVAMLACSEVTAAAVTMCFQPFLAALPNVSTTSHADNHQGVRIGGGMVEPDTHHTESTCLL